MDCFGTYFTHAQSCDNVRVPSATEWTASVHTLHMPNDSVRVQSGAERTALVHTLHGPKAVITFVFKVLLGTCSIFTFSLFRVSAFSRFAFSCFRAFRVFVLSHVRFWRFRVFGFSRFAGGIRVAETQISFAQ